jgi:hypothetical protein
MSADPTSLDRLHDIVTPPPAPWWPPAPGWYVVLGVGGLLLLWAGIKLAVGWRRDSYRRAALAELAALRTSPGPDFLARLSALLKRAALATYPRNEVAELSGDAWLEFLDRNGGVSAFVSGPGRPIADGPYARPAPLDDSASEALFAACRFWLQHHRRGDAC